MPLQRGSWRDALRTTRHTNAWPVQTLVRQSGKSQNCHKARQCVIAASTEPRTPSTRTLAPYDSTSLDATSSPLFESLSSTSHGGGARAVPLGDGGGRRDAGPPPLRPGGARVVSSAQGVEEFPVATAAHEALRAEDAQGARASPVQLVASDPFRIGETVVLCETLTLFVFCEVPETHRREIAFALPYRGTKIRIRIVESL